MRIHLRSRYVVACGLVVALAITGIVWLLSRGAVQKPHVQTHPPEIKDVISYSTSKPSQNPIQASSYVSTARPMEPKYISLPSIAASGFIQKVGIDQNGQIATPNNVNLAAWYVNSVAPGQPGLSIILGHVDGYTSPGIFIHLSKLKPGDHFTVQLGSGTLLTYDVIKVVAVSASNAVSTLFSQDPNIKSQLNLVTCGGTFNSATKSYAERVVVDAALINQ